MPISQIFNKETTHCLNMMGGMALLTGTFNGGHRMVSSMLPNWISPPKGSLIESTFWGAATGLGFVVLNKFLSPQRQSRSNRFLQFTFSALASSSLINFVFQKRETISHTFHSYQPVIAYFSSLTAVAALMRALPRL